MPEAYDEHDDEHDDYEALLTLEFLEQLRHNPDARAPLGLDPQFAETLRRLVRAHDASTEELSRDAKNNIWRQALQQADLTPSVRFSTNGKVNTMNQPQVLTLPLRIPRNRERRFFTAGLITLLAASLVIMIFGRFLIVPSPFAGVTSTVTPTNNAKLLLNSVVYQSTQKNRVMSWSPDGTQVAAVIGNDDQIGLFDGTGKLTHTLIGHSGRINQLMWSPDGKLLVSAGYDKSVRLWTAVGETAAILSAHANAVDSVAWSPDGTILASASSLDGTIRLWTPKGEPLRTFQFRPTSADGSTTLYWSPNAQYLAVHYSDNNADIWTRDGRLLTSFDRIEQGSNALAWSPDSQHVALTTIRDGLRIYAIDGTLEKSLIAPNAALVPLIALWSPDGRFVAAWDFRNNLYLWDVNSVTSVNGASTPTVHRFDTFIYDVGFSPDGTLLAVALTDNAEGRIELVDRQLQVQYSQKVALRSGSMLFTAWSPDGRTLVSKFESQRVSVFSLDGKIIAAAQAITPVAVLQTQVPINTSSTPTTTPQDNPLILGQMAQGELTREQREQAYTFTADFEGRLLVVLQSTEFAVNLSSQVMCPASGGGGGGGGGGSETGGSPLFKPQLVTVCKGGAVRLMVNSLSRTELGKFTIIAYPVTTEPLQVGKTITDSIGSKTNFHYYTLSATMGDLITVQFIPTERGKLQLTPDGLYLNLPAEGALLAPFESTTIIRNSGEVGLLVTAATAGAEGNYRLLVTKQEPALLSSHQSLTLNTNQPSVAFRIKGSAKPLLLKLKGQGGTMGANLSVQTIVGNEAGTDPRMALAPPSPVAVLRVEPHDDLSYKLNLVPDQAYLLLIESSGGTTDTLDLEISLE